MIALIPVAAGREAELGEALAALTESPFARLDGTHVARWAVIPFLRGNPWDGPPAVDQPHLFFAADFDGAAERWLGQLGFRLGAEGDAVFGCCAGWPGSAGLARWIDDHRVRAGFSVVGSPGVPVGVVRAALAQRKALRALVERAGSLSPAELRREFLAGLEERP